MDGSSIIAQLIKTSHEPRNGITFCWLWNWVMEYLIKSKRCTNVICVSYSTLFDHESLCFCVYNFSFFIHCVHPNSFKCKTMSDFAVGFIVAAKEKMEMRCHWNHQTDIIEIKQNENSFHICQIRSDDFGLCVYLPYGFQWNNLWYFSPISSPTSNAKSQKQFRFMCDEMAMRGLRHQWIPQIWFWDIDKSWHRQYATHQVDSQMNGMHTVCSPHKHEQSL